MWALGLKSGLAMLPHQGVPALVRRDELRETVTRNEAAGGVGS